MKSLQQYLTESMVNESYKARFKPADWENVLKQFKPKFSNYSQLGGLENFAEEGDVEGWIDNMISKGMPDTPENRDVLTDIINWTADNYESKTFSWRDDAESIVDYVNDINNDTTMWGVSEEDYALIMIPVKRLTGNDKKLGEVLAKYGNSGDLEDIASQYSY